MTAIVTLALLLLGPGVASAAGHDAAPAAFVAARRPPVPPTYRWDLRAATPGPPMFADKLDYPVLPSHVLRLDYETTPTAGQTLVVQVARAGARWHVVAVCPKPATLVEMEGAKKARAEQEQTVSAIHHDEREAGVDTTTAKGVVDRLIEETR